MIAPANKPVPAFDIVVDPDAEDLGSVIEAVAEMLVDLHEQRKAQEAEEPTEGGD